MGPCDQGGRLRLERVVDPGLGNRGGPSEQGLHVAIHVQLFGNATQGLVSRPEEDPFNPACGKEMGINVAKADAVERLALKQHENFLMPRYPYGGECLKQLEDFLAIPDASAGEFAHDEGVNRNVSRAQQVP